MEEEVESNSGIDPGDDIRIDGLPNVAGHHYAITHLKKVARRCKVCHIFTLRMCHKCQVHLHMANCFAI